MSTNTSNFLVLVAEDDADSAAALAMMLNLAGYEVHVAKSGAEAVSMAGALHPDVVLLDIGLPGMNGYEAAKQIRAHRHIPPPVLIAVTGHGKEDDVQRAKDSGFDRHLLKPTDPPDLMRLLANIRQARAEPSGDGHRIDAG